MNKERRKQIDAILDALEPLVGQIEDLAGEETDAFENLPESMQEGERGQTMETAASELEEAHTGLETVIENLNNAKGD